MLQNSMSTWWNMWQYFFFYSMFYWLYQKSWFLLWLQHSGEIMSYFQIWQAFCHIWVISSVTRGQQCATEMKCIEKPICLTKLIPKLLFLYNIGPRHVFWTKWDKYNMKKVKLVKLLMTGNTSCLWKWHNTVIPMTDDKETSQILSPGESIYCHFSMKYPFNRYWWMLQLAMSTWGNMSQ